MRGYKLFDGLRFYPNEVSHFFQCQCCKSNTQYFAKYLTIIPLALVGYEMIDSQRGVGYNHLISNKREWNNCFIKNNHEMLLDLADFALQEQAEDNLMAAFS